MGLYAGQNFAKHALRDYLWDTTSSICGTQPRQTCGNMKVRTISRTNLVGYPNVAPLLRSHGLGTRDAGDDANETAGKRPERVERRQKVLAA